MPPIQPPPLKLALACFGSALCFLAAGSLGLVWIAPDLATAAYPLPRVVAVVHLFTLGWITLSMVAALHHFVPVALHTRLLPLPLAWTQLAAFDLGLAGFTAGELLAMPVLAWGGAALCALALLLFALGLAAAMLRVARRGRTAYGLLAAAVFLAITLGLGVTLAGARSFGWAAAQRAALLSLHVRVALTGWVLLVVLAVGQRLLPMFLLTRAPGARSGVAALLLVGAGALGSVLAYGRSGAAAVLPLLFAGVGVAIFLAQAARTFRRGNRAQLDPGMRLAGAGLAFLGLALLIAPFATGADSLRVPGRVILFVGTVVLGALSPFIAGHYYRLVPFLVWTARWGAAGAVAGPRSPGGLYSAPLARAALLLLVAGAGSILAAAGLGFAAGVRAGAVAFVGGVAVLAWQMLRVMTSQPR